MPDRSAPPPLLTLYAPPVFRVREMEKWLKHQGATQATPVYSCCSMCGPLGVPGSTPPSTKQISRRPSVIATRTPADFYGTNPSARPPPRTTTPQNNLPTNLARNVSTRTASTSVKSAVIPERTVKRPPATATQTLVDATLTIDARYYVGKHGAKQ